MLGEHFLELGVAFGVFGGKLDASRADGIAFGHQDGALLLESPGYDFAFDLEGRAFVIGGSVSHTSDGR